MLFNDYKIPVPQRKNYTQFFFLLLLFMNKIGGWLIYPYGEHISSNNMIHF